MNCCGGGAQNSEENLENQSLITYKTPELHLKNKGIFEKLFSFLISSIDYDLTKGEISAFRDLQNDYLDDKNQGIKPFDQKSEQHNQYITSLYYTLTGETMKADEIENEAWITFGFQQKNPRTDFRGSGAPGAVHLLNFAEKNEEIIKQMRDPQNYFFFAISSIKVSDFLMKYFQIPKNLNYSENKNVIASRKAFKNFCRILNKNPFAFYDFHKLVLKHLFLNHLDLINKNTMQKFLTISDQQRFEATSKKFIAVLESDNFRSFEQFKVAFWGKNDQKSQDQKKKQ